jgi:hypothetical protein
MKTKQPFVVVWISPRDLSHRGSYFYGKKAEAQRFLGIPTLYGSTYYCDFMSGHKTIEEAKAKAGYLTTLEPTPVSPAPITDFFSN